MNKDKVKSLVTAIALVLLFVSVASAREKAPATREQAFVPREKARVTRDQALLARVTVYWAKGGAGSDRYTRQHKTSTGMRLRDGHCAVDPRRIPYGSQIIFPDRTRLFAVDTGTAVKNRKAARLSGRTVNERSAIVVDRFFETKQQALSWARRNPAFMPVRVILPDYRSRSPVSQIAPPTVASTAPVSALRNRSTTNRWSIASRR
jgi:3D (Asp-Asp-Asp) domain-containing protein